MLDTPFPFVCEQVCGEPVVVVNVHTEAEVAALTVSDMASCLDEQMSELRTVVVAGHLNLHAVGKSHAHLSGHFLTFRMNVK